MRKTVGISLVCLLTAGIAACGDEESLPGGPSSEESVEENAPEMTTEEAEKIYKQFYESMHSPTSTEDVVNEFATTEFVDDIVRENGSSFEGARDVLIERSQYWEHDLIENETTHVTEASANAAETRIDRTILKHSFAKSPYKVECSVTNSWVVEGGAWKIDGMDTSDCERALGNTQF